MIVRQLCFNRRQKGFVTAHAPSYLSKARQNLNPGFPYIQRQRLSNMSLYDDQPDNCHEARQARIWRITPDIAYSGSLKSREPKGMDEGLQPASGLPVV